MNDNTNAFQRRYINELVRCDSLEQKLNDMISEIKKDKITIDMANIEDLPKPLFRDFVQTESMITKYLFELKTLKNNLSDVQKLCTKEYLRQRTLMKMSELLELINVADDGDGERLENLLTVREFPRAENTQSGLVTRFKFSTITGLIDAHRMMSFEKMLWRLFGKNVHTRIMYLDDPIPTGDPNDPFVHKNFFAVFFNGQTNIRAKLVKLCSAFNANTFEMSHDINADVLQSTQQLSEFKMVVRKSEDCIRQMLLNVSSKVAEWKMQCVKYRAIFTALNKFNFNIAQKCMVVKLWCPVSDERYLSELCQRFNQTGLGISSILLERIEHNPDEENEYPTFFRLNKFTQGFQNIVDSYGVANYQEMNPAPYTIITFPFLFAVMFGDAGHGIIMFMFALWMVLKESSLGGDGRKIKNEIWALFFGGRYIILLMGIFSIYTGLIYNDVFSKSVNIFGSSFFVPTGLNSSKTDQMTELNPLNASTGSPYPFGVDPIWQLSANKILFLNSYKMKMSVILGVSQMLFGVSLSLLNHMHFRRYLNIFCEFIPQVGFLMFIFGYMNLLIFAKWFKYDRSTQGNAPSILINLINMFLMKYPEGPDAPIYLQEWYPGQRVVQTFLLIGALLCIPWILFPKVFILWRRNQVKTRQFGLFSENALDQLSQNELIGENGPLSNGSGYSEQSDKNHGHKEFDFGDTFIHQAIHTIEYCLGSISHTASYLRLWALSLAHAQLSEVLWNMVFRPGLSGMHSMPHSVNALLTFVCFSVWAVLSVAVLIVMEGLSAFLHALRLHWVEFQSKFYTGAGVSFEPFSFKTILSELDI